MAGLKDILYPLVALVVVKLVSTFDDDFRNFSVESIGGSPALSRTKKGVWDVSITDNKTDGRLDVLHAAWAAIKAANAFSLINETEPTHLATTSMPVTKPQPIRIVEETTTSQAVTTTIKPRSILPDWPKQQVPDRWSSLFSIKENVDLVSGEIARITRDADQFRPDDALYASLALENVLRSNQTLDNNITKNLVVAMGNMMEMDAGVLAESQRNNQTARRMIQNIEMCAERMNIDSAEKEKITVHRKLAIALQRTDDTLDGNLTFHLKRGDTSEDFTEEMLGTDEPEDVSTVEVALTIPRSALGGSPRNVYFVVYNTDKFFKVLQGSGSSAMEPTMQPYNPQERERISLHKINSKVIAAGVVGMKVKDLEMPVKQKFRHISKNADMPECSYWNFDKYDRMGGWSTDGMSVEQSTDDFTVCNSNHMTNFALLMDVYDSGVDIDEVNQKALSLISIIGCAISLTGLFLTLFTYFWFKKLRRDNPAKILINLCAALFFVVLVFLISSQPAVRSNTVACKIMAILLHYVLLAAMCWMMVESYYLYLALVKVFQTYYSRFLLKCCVVAWGLPLLIVIITVSVSPENYTNDKEICWLERRAFYGAFLAPVSVILLLNLIAFAVVIHQLRTVASRKLEKSKRTNLASQFRGAVGITVLLGLTWIFAFFAIGGASIVFHYLFALSNSLQGVFIFSFYCLLKPDVQRAWRRCLPCCPTPPDDSRSSTASRAKSTNFSTVTDHSRKLQASNKMAANDTEKQTGNKETNGFMSATGQKTLVVRDDRSVSLEKEGSNGTDCKPGADNPKIP